MLRHYKRKVFILLTILLLIFTTICILALTTNAVLLPIGIPNFFMNKLIAFFSFLCILFILWDMISA
ncbi:hypothetical protein CL620_05590 [archaeon]|nr:hypothetical protein [archaeon]